VNKEDLEKIIIKIEIFYGFSLSIDKKEKERHIKMFTTINPIRKNYNKNKMDFLAKYFEKYWKCKRKIIYSKHGDTYMFYKVIKSI
jgi:hypothetical protein